jgi:hypothetical protein
MVGEQTLKDVITTGKRVTIIVTILGNHLRVEPKPHHQKIMIGNHGHIGPMKMGIVRTPEQKS